MADQTNGTQGNTLALLSALMDNFPDMIHSVDQEGNIVFFNNKALELLGYTAEELVGMNIRKLYAPEILEAVEQGFREIKEAGQKLVESLFVTSDGTRIPVELRTLAIRDEDGTFVQTFTISRDIRKLKEQQDGMLNAGRLAAIGELAAGVVHDIGTPLASVSLSVSMLQQLIDDSPDLTASTREQSSGLLAMARESAESIERVTSRLRDFSRGVKERYAPVDLFDCIHEALFTLGQRLSANAVQVYCPVVKARHWVFGERNQITQVFLNLVVNACDALADREQRRLGVDVAQEGKGGRYYWHCIIRDTGAGIAPEDMDRVFNAFCTTKADKQATGLGLCIVRSILTEHSGEISVESELGKGTTFHVWLPVYVQRVAFQTPAAST
jgi:PAS domain S-box-containing protein